jgi:hypothetical protein
LKIGIYAVVLLGLMIAVGTVRYAFKSQDQIQLDQKNYSTHLDDNKTIRIDLGKVIQSYKGKEKAQFLVNMAVDLLQDERRVFLKVLLEGIKKDDMETNIEIVHALPLMKLHAPENEKIANEICILLKDPTNNKFKERFEQDFAILKIELKNYCH